MNEKFNDLVRIEETQYYSKHYDKIGVNHDHDKYISFTKKSKRTKFKIAELLKNDYLTDKNLSTFCFVASGYEDLERLSFIQYNQIICIDTLIPKYECVIISEKQRIFKIPLDLISAISVMRECKIKIDCWCDNNSGQVCGFGEGYATLSNIVLSTAMELFDEKLVVVASYQYQKKVCNYQIAKNYLKLPNSIVRKLNLDELKEYHLDFDTSLITLYPHSSAPIDYHLIEIQSDNIEKVFIYKGKKIHMVKGNIFNYMTDIELKMLVFRSVYQFNQYRNNYSNTLEARGRYLYNGKTYDLNNTSDLINLIELLECQSIGFIPQNNKEKDWEGLLNELCQSKLLNDLYFFHIDQNDFTELYRLLNEIRN